MSWSTVTRQALRGVRSLPHVGAHPGTVPVVAFGVALPLAGGWGGVAMWLLLFVLPYLYGAHERATLSDRLSSSRSGG